MSKPVWREELVGTSLGVIVLTVFGFVWASLGTSTLPVSMLTLVASMVVSLALILAGLYLRRAARSAPNMPRGTMKSGTMKRFQLIGIAEGVAIGVAVFVLTRLGYPAWIPAVVALIVGIHFFPLAPLFRVRAYFFTGALLCLVFALTVLLATVSDTVTLLAVVPGVGSALVLWGTGAFLVVSSFRRLRTR